MAERHVEHDPLHVAAHAAGDPGGEAAMGEVLVRECGECAALADDLRAIAAATAALPPLQRPRDFSLTQADASRLRRRRLGGLGWPSRLIGRPLAGGLMAMGLAGILFSTVPSMLTRSSAGAADPGGDPAASRETVIGQGEGDAAHNLPAPGDAHAAIRSPGRLQSPGPAASAPPSAFEPPRRAPSEPPALLAASVFAFMLGGTLYVALDLRRGRGAG